MIKRIGQDLGSVLEGVQDTLRAPPEEQQVGIGGFTTFATVSESVGYSSTVPVHVLEDGAYANDQFIQNPITVSIQGVVSEVNLAPAVTDIIARTVGDVGTVSGFLPERTQTQVQAIGGLALQVRDAVDRVGQLVEAGQNAYDLVGDKSESVPVREQFLDWLEAVWQAKLPIPIETKYRQYENMAITSLQISRDNQTESLTFSLVAQQIRLALTVFEEIEAFFEAPAPVVKAQTETAQQAGQKTEDMQNAANDASRQSSLYAATYGSD